MTEHYEPHEPAGARLNWLRAGVLGANDGIVSTASLVVGVAGAAASAAAVLTAGVAGLFAGALSMAAGEYVSVSSQRDSEKALLAKEERELREQPGEELEELVELYMEKGLNREVATEVAEQLTAKNALAAHAEIEIGIDPDELTNPWQAAGASFLSFIVGALLPLLAMALSPLSIRVLVTVVAVTLALALTGWISAGFGRSPRGRAVARNIAGGLVAMGITYAIGTVVGQAV